jgi:hypothetical protein
MPIAHSSVKEIIDEIDDEKWFFKSKQQNLFH